MSSDQPSTLPPRDIEFLTSYLKEFFLLTYLFTYFLAYIHTYVPAYLPACYLPAYLPPCLPSLALPCLACLPTYLPTYPPTYLLTYLLTLPSDKCNSIMAIATGLIFSLFSVASSQDMVFTHCSISSACITELAFVLHSITA